MIKKILSSIFISCAVTFNAYPDTRRHKKDIPYTITTIYGNETIEEAVLQELIECPTVQRLRQINQYGVCFYAWKAQEFNRYAHSLGVMVLLRRFGADLNEQIAGLLHDVSHTIFSHVGDWVFNERSDDSYQDNIHKWFLEQTEIPEILAHYNISLDDVMHKSGNFKALDQSLPDICCDRLEYNLYGGLIENIISIRDVHDILDHVRFENNIWYFTSPVYAKRYALISARLTEEIFAAPWNEVVNTLAARALNRAVDIELITLNDIHFSTDHEVWDKLIESDDEIVKSCMHKIMNHEQHFTLKDETNYDIFTTPKCRVVNPMVHTKDGLKRLSEVDELFAREYMRIKNKLQAGFYIKLLDS